MGVLAISACSDVGAGVANDDGGGDGDGGLGPGDGGEGIRNADASSSTYAIGGSVAGLAGTGLVLTNSGKNDVAVAAGATSYAFTTKVPTATPYAVAVKSQPTSPSQTCVVANGAGTVSNANVTNANVTCTTNAYQVCATVSGLADSIGDAGVGDAGTGTLVLKNNGGDAVSVSANGQVCFPTKVASGAAFAVTDEDPTNPGHTCTVTGGTGTVGAGDVTTVAINCTPTTYTIGGNVAGLAGTVVLAVKDGSGSELQTANVNSLGQYSFATPFPFGQS
ncbi:MAG TPA: hypothetical protein VM925_27150, partial [Labilithrix sp.]|nr:hypothetical protein [Labilithrix sp.]